MRVARITVFRIFLPIVVSMLAACGGGSGDSSLPTDTATPTVTDDSAIMDTSSNEELISDTSAPTVTDQTSVDTSPIITVTDDSAITDTSNNELPSSDTTAPTTPTVTNQTTEDTTPVITGTYDSADYSGGFTVAANSVTYTLGTDSELTNSGNNWFLAIPADSEFSLGTYSIVATATDGAGNSTSDTSNNELHIHDSTSPTVSSTSPTANATAVARNSTVTATFDEDIFATTVDGTSFSLMDSDSSSVTGTVSFDGATNIATFMPASDLSKLTTYTATLSTGITDLVGNPMTVNYPWSFTSADGAWGTAELLDTDNAGDAFAPQVAFDPSGNAIAVWHQSDGAGNRIWTNRYIIGSGWGTASMIDTENTGAKNPQVDVNASGNAFAVWEQYDGSHWNIWANRYVAESRGVAGSWGTATQIESNVGDANFPQVTIDRYGHAIAVWQQHDGSRYNIWASRYFNWGGGWGTAEIIEYSNAGSALHPQVAIDASGNAFVVWKQQDGSSQNVWSNRFFDTFNGWGGGWGTAMLLETSDGVADMPQVAVNASGNAIAVWSQSGSIWARRYTDGLGWRDATLIEVGSVNVISPQVAINASGNAIAVWQQHYGSRSDIWAKHYSPGYLGIGGSWDTAVLIDNSEGPAWGSPQVAIDASGNAIAVWGQANAMGYDGVQNIWSNRYVAGSGWGTAELIETDDTGYDGASDPQVAIDFRGNATAVWWQHEGRSYNIMTNRFE